MEDVSEDETTFLCGYQRQRRYGSLSTPTGSRPKFSQVLHHAVQPDDTLQGIALRYNSSMTEIKRLNKLWSNESLYLKSVLLVPLSAAVAADSDGMATTSGSSSGSEFVDCRASNGDTSATVPTTIASPNVITANTSQRIPPLKKSGQSPATTPTTSVEESPNDLFSRIDLSIQSTARKVKRLERNSTLGQVLEDDDSGMVSSYSRHSLRGVPSSSGDTPHVEVEAAPWMRSSLKRLHRSEERFYQL